MRAISLVDRLEFEFSGNVLRKGLTLGDVDNDGNNELIVGGENGDVFVFKGSEKWQTLNGLNFVSCVAVGDILNRNKNCLVVVTADGWCHIFCCVTQTFSLSDSSDTQPEEKSIESSDQPDGQVFSSESIESEKSSSDSGANSSLDKEKTVLKRVHVQRIPANSKDIILGDIDGDGCIEMVLGLTDRVVRSYRWFSSSHATQTDNQDVFENVSGRLVGLNKWECANQIGSVTLHHSKDGTPALLIAQPGGTFMRIVCQSEETIARSMEATGDNSDSGSSRSESLVGSKVDYQFLGQSRMRNQNISTEIVGDLKTRQPEEAQDPESDNSESASSSKDTTSDTSTGLRSFTKTKPKSKPYAVATLDGTIILVQDEVILWAFAVDHQIFALCKLDVTDNGSDDIVACSWDGQTYILDQDKNSVRFHLEESVQAFDCGYYTMELGAAPVTCFVYVTFRNKVYLYYDVPLKEMICRKYEPEVGKFECVLDEGSIEEGLDRNAKKKLVEYLLYRV